GQVYAAGGRGDVVRAGQLHGHVRIERPLDVEVVVAGAEQEVDDLDRALRAVRRELAIDELDGAEADPSGEDRRLAERLRVAGVEDRAEVEILGKAEAADAGGRHRPRAILEAAVVIDVEHVDLLRLGRLRADREDRRVLLAG